MNGLSPTELAKTTSFAAPRPASVACAEAEIASPMARTASMLTPAREDATLTDEQTTSVAARAWGMESMSARSLAVAPPSTSAENPPMKSTPTARAASSSILAQAVRSDSREAAATRAIGVTETRLLTIGMPSSSSILPHTDTRPDARAAMRS